jgi:hypothetical protein
MPSPRIVQTLQAVSYLVPSYGQSSTSTERTYRRLLETFQFVIDVMGCDPDVSCSPEKSSSYLLPGGEGWKSVIRVRMLHGIARARAKARLGSQDFVPINQHDLGAT